MADRVETRFALPENGPRDEARAVAQDLIAAGRLSDAIKLRYMLEGFIAHDDSQQEGES